MNNHYLYSNNYIQNNAKDRYKSVSSYTAYITSMCHNTLALLPHNIRYGVEAFNDIVCSSASTSITYVMEVEAFNDIVCLNQITAYVKALYP